MCQWPCFRAKTEHQHYPSDLQKCICVLGFCKLEVWFAFLVGKIAFTTSLKQTSRRWS